VWPPSDDPRRAPYRGGEPFEDIDAGVFFGRDVAIVRGMDALRAMRLSGTESLFVVLGPSGSGKSSLVRAGLIPRLQRDDREFLTLGIMRPERSALTGIQDFAAHHLRGHSASTHPPNRSTTGAGNDTRRPQRLPPHHPRREAHHEGAVAAGRDRMRQRGGPRAARSTRG
jgi:hypothetical protein